MPSILPGFSLSMWNKPLCSTLSHPILLVLRSCKKLQSLILRALYTSMLTIFSSVAQAVRGFHSLPFIVELHCTHKAVWKTINSILDPNSILLTALTFIHTLRSTIICHIYTIQDQFNPRYDHFNLFPTRLQLSA